MVMFVVYVHYDHFGRVAVEGGLNGRTVSVADMATYSAASHFYRTRFTPTSQFESRQGAFVTSQSPFYYKQLMKTPQYT